MGITIHYSGKFRTDASLNEMINEAAAFAKHHQWEYHLFETSFDALVPVDSANTEIRYGLIINPPNCESVHLYFNSEKQLGFFHDWDGFIPETWIGDEQTGIGKWVPDTNAEDYKPHWGAFTKTAYAGKSVHMKIVELFKLLSPKYFTDFKVIDESGYWDHEDAQMLDFLFENEDMRLN